MNIQKEVVEEIAKYLGVTPQDIDPNASLAEDLEMGPIELADMLTALASRFDINFDPADVEVLRTVNDIVVLIEDLSLE